MLDVWQEILILSLVNMNASEMGKKGGTARMRALSKKQRQELARKAAQARWNGKAKRK